MERNNFGGSANSRRKNSLPIYSYHLGKIRNGPAKKSTVEETKASPKEEKIERAFRERLISSASLSLLPGDFHLTTVFPFSLVLSRAERFATKLLFLPLVYRNILDDFWFNGQLIYTQPTTSDILKIYKTNNKNQTTTKLAAGHVRRAQPTKYFVEIIWAKMSGFFQKKIKIFLWLWEFWPEGSEIKFEHKKIFVYLKVKVESNQKSKVYGCGEFNILKKFNMLKNN